MARQPTRAWQAQAEKLLARIGGQSDVANRLRMVADALVGRPYYDSPLIGGPEEQEKLVVDLSGFDCVTFVETALALARSRSSTRFASELRQTRYRGGVVDWQERLHYFSDWLRENQRRGALRLRTSGSGSRRVETRLGMLVGLRQRRVTLSVVPKRQLHQALGRLAGASVIAFASVRARLDYFHVGLVFSDPSKLTHPDHLTLFHASRSRGRVLRMPLSAFLRDNRMRGISFAEVLGVGSR